MEHHPDPANRSKCVCGEHVTFFLPGGVRLCGTGFWIYKGYDVNPPPPIPRNRASSNVSTSPPKPLTT